MKLEIKDRGKNNTMMDVEMHNLHHILPKTNGNLRAYIFDAMRTIDDLSKDFNPVGIDHIICIMQILLDNQYYGEKNSKSELTADKILKLIYDTMEAKKNGNE